MLRAAGRTFAGGSLIFALAVIAAATAAGQILNSERIERTFGSYGIDVLYSDESLRLSNLYSEQDGNKITRTLAFVEYPEFIDRSFATEHQAIVAGGSIGSTFTAAGWAVVKHNLSIVELGAPVEFAGWMGVEQDEQLATHFYRLDIERDKERYVYAFIAELHHPDYLREADLKAIYPLDLEPQSDDSGGQAPRREEILSRHLGLLSAGRLQFQESGLSLSQ